MANKAIPSPTDINLLASFLANSQVPSLTSISPPTDAIILCASSVLHPAINLFHTLSSHPSLTKTLLLCGGIGHSTPLIYAAIAAHPLYHPLLPSIQGLPESQVLLKLLETYFDIPKITSQGCKILVEDKSTNCGANAVESRKVLEKSYGVEGLPKRILLMQDATMSLRTKASLDRVFNDLKAPPEVVCWPGFVPKVRLVGDVIEFAVEDGVQKEALWEMERFLNLIMGEIPRLETYGPRGTGSIVDVEVPGEVREAWERLDQVLGNGR